LAQLIGYGRVNLRQRGLPGLEIDQVGHGAERGIVFGAAAMLHQAVHERVGCEQLVAQCGRSIGQDHDCVVRLEVPQRCGRAARAQRQAPNAAMDFHGRSRVGEQRRQLMSRAWPRHGTETSAQ
jgi:hypothetical protein